MRKGIIHLVAGQTHKDNEVRLYNEGEHSYFSESAYTMDNWGERYWGRDNYKRLKSIKDKYDPKGVFACHHCIGDNESSRPIKPFTTAMIIAIVGGSALVVILLIVTICCCRKKRNAKLRNELEERFKY